MKELIKTKAVVLKKKSLLDKNVLLTFLTFDLGKVDAFAFGIKKITSRRLSYSQIGNLVKIVLEKKKERFYLKEIDLISGFLSIKENDKKWQNFYLYFYILERILPYNTSDKNVFQLTLDFLINLARNDQNLHQLNYYLNQLLKSLGYLNKNQSLNNNIRLIEEIINENLPNFSL